ncbi:hypothetical protein BOX15_Mlig019651g2 [Macrostomum lignano]|uniref:H15 domain-containing protein n=1 Tax=Macrostomum lignano TaxID=282301 RepID=A0A267FP79_9PLAT|nr:hypothetical protein BOX15_Mlig019651g2 [Macrostomum lignano]
MSATVAKAAGQKKPSKPKSHPSYTDMISAAIAALKERKGSSRQAITKYLLANYKFNSDEKIDFYVKAALKAGSKSGRYVHTKGVGATGSFQLAKKESAAKSKKPMAPKSPNKAKSPIASKKPKSPAAKKAKSPAAAKKPKSPAAAKKPKSPVAAKKPSSPVAAKRAKSPVAKKPRSPKPMKAKSPAGKRVAAKPSEAAAAAPEPAAVAAKTNNSRAGKKGAAPHHCRWRQAEIEDPDQGQEGRARQG